MVDKIFYKLFSWIDDQFKKVEDVWTFDFCNCKDLCVKKDKLYNEKK